MAPSHCSGLYATQAEAEKDMVADQTASPSPGCADDDLAEAFAFREM